MSTNDTTSTNANADAPQSAAVPPEHVAVIAAAVIAVLGESARAHSIRPTEKVPSVRVAPIQAGRSAPRIAAVRGSPKRMPDR